MSRIAIVRVTCADAAEAERIARAAVDERLAACANIEAPCRSIYRWRGAVEEATEVPVLFKTTVTGTAALAARVAALHGYDLPAVEWWTADAGAALVAWVEENTGPIYPVL